MSQEGMKLSYTIARATSYPINRVFSGAGYKYGGRLTNNTNICGSIESMNVWYKYLDTISRPRHQYRLRYQPIEWHGIGADKRPNYFFLSLFSLRF